MEQNDFMKEIAAPNAGMSRRKFFGLASGLAGLGLLATLDSCKKNDDNNNPTPTTVDLGSGDVGLLNYAFALEQLEAAFYTQVIANPYSSIGTGEMSLLTDIRDHEIAHREFFKTAIPAASRIQGLTPDFSSITFSSKASVLAAAMAFEDLGVSAYNGAGHLFSNTVNGNTYLGLAGKIVSVEARHAAYLRELVLVDSFAGTDVVDAVTGLDMARTPAAVLAMAQKYIKETITATNLPQ